MKITVSFVSNMFIVIFIAILPYISILRTYIVDKSEFVGDDFILKIILKDVIISVIVYMISLVGYTIAENNIKEKSQIKKISIPYFTLLFATAVLQLIIGMFSFLLPEIIMSNSSLIKSVTIFGLSIWTIIMFYLVSKKSVLFLIPILVWFMYIYFIPSYTQLIK